MNHIRICKGDSEAMIQPTEHEVSSLQEESLLDVIRPAADDTTAVWPGLLIADVEPNSQLLLLREEFLHPPMKVYPQKYIERHFIGTKKHNITKGPYHSLSPFPSLLTGGLFQLYLRPQLTFFFVIIICLICMGHHSILKVKATGCKVLKSCS